MSSGIREEQIFIANLKGDLVAPMYRYISKAEAYNRLKQKTGQDFGYNVSAWANYLKTQLAGGDTLAQWLDFYTDNHIDLSWDARMEVFIKDQKRMENSWSEMGAIARKQHYISDALYPDTSFYRSQGRGEDEYLIVGFYFDDKQDILRFYFTTYHDLETMMGVTPLEDSDPLESFGFISLNMEQMKGLLRLLKSYLPRFKNQVDFGQTTFQEITPDSYAVYRIASRGYVPHGIYLLDKLPATLNMINISVAAPSPDPIAIRTVQLPENMEHDYLYYADRSRGRIDFTASKLVDFCDLLERQISTVTQNVNESV